MRRLLILLLSLALFSAACGDDSNASADASDDDTSADDDDGGNDGADDDGDAGGDDTADDDGDGDDGDDGDDATDDAGPGAGAGAGSDFCELYTNEYDDLGTDSIDFTSSPEELEDAVTRIVEVLDDVRGSAPSEIRGDLDVIYENITGLADVLAANDWDMVAASQDMTDLDSEAVTQATENIDAFCGVEEDGFGSTDADDPSAVIDPDIIDDLESVDPDDADAMGLLIWQSLGHDEETARCLIDELGTFDELPEDPGPDLMTQQYCGMTMIEILTGG